MPMTRSTAVGSIVTGSIELGFAVITVICGAISASKMSGDAAASAGLWSLYYAVPGILTIIAGATKNGVVMGFALFFNIIAVIVSIVATILLIILTAALQTYTRSGCTPLDVLGTKQCKCIYVSDDGSTTTQTFDMSCDNFDTISTVVLAITVVYVLLSITTLTASIYGCMGTCCAPMDPVVIVTTGTPAVQAGSTVVVTSNQSNMQSCYPAVMPQPGYAQAAPPGYGQPPPNYADKSGLVKNMAI